MLSDIYSLHDDLDIRRQYTYNIQFYCYGPFAIDGRFTALVSSPAN